MDAATRQPVIPVDKAKIEDVAVGKVKNGKYQWASVTPTGMIGGLLV